MKRTEGVERIRQARDDREPIDLTRIVGIGRVDVDAIGDEGRRRLLRQA